MKLTDENGKEYKFKQTDRDVTFGITGTLKPIDEWPQEGDVYWYVDEYGEPDRWRYSNANKDHDSVGIYRTKQEAELARDRIQSLQEATELTFFSDNSPEYEEVKPINFKNDILISFVLPKKYLKAWKALEDKK